MARIGLNSKSPAKTESWRTGPGTVQEIKHSTFSRKQTIHLM